MYKLFFSSLALVLPIAVTGCASLSPKERVAPSALVAFEQADGVDVSLRLDPPADLLVPQAEGGWMPVRARSDRGSLWAWQLQLRDGENGAALPGATVRLAISGAAWQAEVPMETAQTDRGLSYLALSDALMPGDYRIRIYVASLPLARDQSRRNRWVTARSFEYAIAVSDDGVSMPAPQTVQAPAFPVAPSTPAVGEVDAGRWQLSLTAPAGQVVTWDAGQLRPLSGGETLWVVKADGVGPVPPLALEADPPAPTGRYWSAQGVDYFAILPSADEGLRIAARPLPLPRMGLGAPQPFDVASVSFDPPAKPPPPVAPAAPRGKGYGVRLGVFGDPGNVRRLLSGLDRTGIPAYTTDVQIKGRRLQQVFAGPFPVRGEADAVRQQVASNFDVRGKVIEVCMPVGTRCR